MNWTSSKREEVLFPTVRTFSPELEHPASLLQNDLEVKAAHASLSIAEITKM
jgi:hypothetical protein